MFFSNFLGFSIVFFLNTSRIVREVYFRFPGGLAMPVTVLSSVSVFKVQIPAGSESDLQDLLLWCEDRDGFGLSVAVPNLGFLARLMRLCNDLGYQVRLRTYRHIPLFIVESGRGCLPSERA